MTRQEMFEIRMILAQQMHDYIINIGDEDIYDIWINYMPDEPCKEDFEYFAREADAFRQICKIFGQLVYKDETENYENY